MPPQARKTAGAGHQIGYARVSTEDQGTDPQTDELRAAGCASVREEHASGADRSRPVLARLLRDIAAGDTLVVVRLDRLARSVSHLLSVIEQLAAKGALSAAVLILDRHLMQYPLDFMAQPVALFLDLYQGRVRWMRDRTARALPLWPKDLPGYGAMLAYHGFGLEETGDYARAEDESRAAAELAPTSQFAHHTVAHVMEMTGRPEDGLGWMQAREAFWSTREHLNQAHIWWHRALFHLDLGQNEAALAIYDGPIHRTQRPT